MWKLNNLMVSEYSALSSPQSQISGTWGGVARKAIAAAAEALVAWHWACVSLYLIDNPEHRVRANNGN